jgi:hypothetical protein
MQSFHVETPPVASILGGEASIAADPRNQRPHEAGRQTAECQYRIGIGTCLVPYQLQPLLSLAVGTRGQQIGRDVLRLDLLLVVLLSDGEADARCCMKLRNSSCSDTPCFCQTHSASSERRKPPWLRSIFLKLGEARSNMA